MKKLLTTLAFILCIFTFAGCDISDDQLHKFGLDRLGIDATDFCVHEPTVTPSVLPTCTSVGLTEGKHCAKCGEIIVAQEEIPQLSHIIMTSPAIEATCIKNGKTESEQCAICGYVAKSADVTQPIGHLWDGGKLIAYPNCVEYGVRRFTCNRCGQEKDELTDKEPHELSTNWTIDIAPTCTENGSKSLHCTFCNEKCEVTVISATGHNWDDGTITAGYDCTVMGFKVFRCNYCGITATISIAPRNHSYSITVASNNLNRTA